MLFLLGAFSGCFFLPGCFFWVLLNKAPVNGCFFGKSTHWVLYWVLFLGAFFLFGAVCGRCISRAPTLPKRNARVLAHMARGLLGRAPQAGQPSRLRVTALLPRPQPDGHGGAHPARLRRTSPAAAPGPSTSGDAVLAVARRRAPCRAPHPGSIQPAGAFTVRRAPAAEDLG